MAIVAVDLGGTVIKIGLISSGRVHQKETLLVHSEKGLQPRLNSLEQKINELRNNSTEAILGIGMAFPGIVDSLQMKVLPFVQQKVDENAWTPWGQVKIKKSS